MNRLRNNTFIYLLLILALATLMRVFLLGSIPRGFSCDEAVNGYESYSIAETLRDRYGNFLPAFINPLKNDAQEALYFYFTVPFIKILGLQEFATRLPAALLGILTVLTVYWLAQEFFNQRVGLVAALLLAINPWHIQVNRMAFRLNLFPLVFCLAILFFVKSFKQPKYLPLSSLFFGLSLYTYSSARVFVPLFLLGITIMFSKHLWKNRRETSISLILFLCIFVPLFKFWVSPEGMARAKGTGIEMNLFVILQNYLSCFSPSFLFFQGINDIVVNPSKIGVLYIFEFITVLFGLLKLFQEDAKTRIILLIWLFLYPIPGCLVGPAYPWRLIVGVPMFAIISAIGITYLVDRWRAKQRTMMVIIGFALIGCLTIFSYQYFIKFPPEAAKLIDYGVKEAIDFAEESSYEGFVFSSDTNSSCFAIYNFISHIPFYTQYPPQKYQISPIYPWVGGSKNKVYSLGKYHLMSISKQKSLRREYLYILRPEQISTLKSKGYKWKEVYRIKDSQGIEYFKLLEIDR